MAAATFDNSTLRKNAPAASGPLVRQPANVVGHRGIDVPMDDEAPHAPAMRKIRVPKQEIADMTAQLAIMTRSGLDLASALASLAAQCERPALAEVLRDVNELVLSGNTLSQALRLHPEVFDAAYVATIAAAEASGRMAEVLKQLAEMQRSECRLRSSIKSLLTYPVLLTGISTSVIAILVVFVLPRFAGIFDQYEVALPVLTRILLSISTELKSRWWLWFPLVGGTIPAILAWRWTEQGRRAIDSFLLHFIVVRNVTRPLLIGRTCNMIGLLLQSGVPLLDGLRLARDAINNCLYRELLSDIAESVVNGRGMGPVLLEAEVIPLSAREMIVTAERTGNLTEVSQLLGGYYEEEAESRMKQLVRILEPLITVVMGLVVAIVVLSVMLPIFDLSTMAH